MAKDSFDPDARTPTSIGELCITLYVVKDAEGAFTYRDFYSFPILDADGEVIERREGALRVHLSPTQQTAVKNFLDALHAKAEGAV
jgi:hypothetical protein